MNQITPWKQFSGLLLCLLFCSQLSGQEIKTFDIHKPARHLGLEPNDVSSIIQDKRGIYWIAGLNGLEMFDGSTTTRFHLPFYKNKIIESNVLVSFFLENDSILWIVNNQGICRFNVFRHVFYPVPIPKDYSSQTLTFTSIIRDSSGGIWMTAVESGLLKYDKKTDRIVKFDHPELSRLGKISVAVNLGKDYLLLSASVLKESYLVDKKGYVVFNYTTNRVEDVSDDPRFRFLSDLRNEVVSFIYFAGRYIYVTAGTPGDFEYHVRQYDQVTKKTTLLPVVSNFGGHKTYRDSSGNVWLFNEGIAFIEKSSGKLYTVAYKEEVGFSQCNNIYEDRSHNLWFCTNDGLYLIEPEKFILENHNEKENGIYKTCFYNTMLDVKPDEVWLSTGGDGLIVTDSGGRLKRKTDLGALSGDPHYNWLFTLYKTRNGKQVWMTSRGGRLVLYDMDKNTFRFYHDTLFREKYVHAIGEDPSGRVYFGSNKTGRIISYDHISNSFRLVYNDNSSGKDALTNISGLYFYDEHTLYISSSSGGFYELKLPEGNIKSYKLDPEDPHSIRSNEIWFMRDIPGKGLFLASSNGLIHFDPRRKTFSSFSQENGLPFSEVYEFIDYENGDLLASTSDGLYTINFNRRSYTKIGRNSPVEMIDFNSFIYRRDQQKLLLFSDYYLYSLQFVKTRPVHSRAYIFSLKTSDTVFHFSDVLPAEIRLGNHQKSFTIRFGSPGYGTQDFPEYSYRIDELGDEWTSGELHEASYNNLKGGNYTFRLRVRSKVGNAADQELVLKIRIEKAFHETVWFGFLLLALPLCLIYVFYRIRLRRLLAIEKVRFKLARDLHDDMGSTLSTINILSSIAGKKISTDPTATGHYLETISSNSQNMMESMNDIVWSINPANDSMQKVISKMQEFANTILEPKSIRFDFTANESLSRINLKMEYRRDFFLIYKEAINNAAKYSECSGISTTLVLDRKKLVLTISDNGKGFDVHAASEGNGMTNMKKRAHSMRAGLHVQSVIGRGTTIELVIPL